MATNVTGLANIDPTTLGLLGLLGGIGGAVPQTSSGTSTTTGNNQFANSGTSSTGSSYSGSTDSLLNFLTTMLQHVSGTTTGATTGATTSTTTPTMDPATQAYLAKLIGAGSGLVNPSLTGYQAQQTGNINTASDLQSQAVNNIMASRGLGTSPVAATAAAGIQQNRLNQITGMQQQIPILQNQLALANLAGATSLFSTIPKGATNTGTQTGTSTGTNTQDTTGTTSGQQTGSTASSGQAASGTVTTGSGESTSYQNTVNKASQGGGLSGALAGAAGGVAGVLGKALGLAALSDKRLKYDIKYIPQSKAIEKIRELKGREWIWKGGETKDTGVIAQELQEVLPELVHTAKVGGSELKAVNYAGLIPYLIGAVQNLDSRIPGGES